MTSWRRAVVPAFRSAGETSLHWGKQIVKDRWFSYRECSYHRLSLRKHAVKRKARKNGGQPAEWEGEKRLSQAPLRFLVDSFAPTA